MSPRRSLLLAAAAAGTLAAAAAAPGAAAQGVYTNPVLARPQGVADPFILKYNGEYYLYATGNPIMAYHSTDLVHWEEIGGVLHGSTEPGAWNQADVWAPEVVYRNGKFYLYYSASRASSDWRVGEAARRVGVAVSDSPRGPFVDSGSPVTPGWAIDGHVFRDPDGGQEYLFYSYLWEPLLPGAGIVVDSLLSPFRVAGTPSNVTKGSEAWEDKDADPNNGSLRYTNEGPTVLKHDGLYYLMYSGGSWDLPTYSLACARSPRVMRGGLDGPGWAKVVPPLLRSTPLVDAPGHNTVVVAPDNVEEISAYHARVVPFNSPGDRQTFLGRVFWHRDRLFMEQPTLGAQPAPDQPLFRDLFDGAAGGLGAGWRVDRGNWRVSGGEATGSGLALLGVPALHAYVFEANVRPHGGRAGVAAYYAGPRDRVDLWLDAGRHALVMNGSLGGKPVPERSVPLPEGFRADAYHQLLVTRNGDALAVMLDGVDALALRLPMGAGTAGIEASGGRADFDGVALTAYYRDTFGDPATDWESRGGTWLAEKGALRQVQGGDGRYAALKGDSAEDYEFIANLLWRDDDSAGSRAGVVAAAAGADTVLAGFDHTIWPFARFRVRFVRGGAVRQELAVEMPRGFQYDVYHDLRVVKQGTGFTFYLDGVEMAAARFPVGMARPGLFTEGVRAAFDDVSMKRLPSPRNLVLNGSFESLPWEAGPTAPAAPWQLTGAATVNMCCGHTGVYRLRLGGADADASQAVTGLLPGSYRLLAWVTTRGGAEAQVSVSPEGSTPQSATASGEAWHRVAVDFTVPEGRSSATITVSGRYPGADAFVAADDFYLYRR
ncbi:MAG TPA: family 43 glycosylhydrolase [Longimicrobiaceae bacterium]|nr:family 43 glycosylhydrolase [Longimicrobiaceae bacterium]